MLCNTNFAALAAKPKVYFLIANWQYTQRPLAYARGLCAATAQGFHILKTARRGIGIIKTYQKNTHTSLPLKGRKNLRGIIVPDKAEDAGGLTPGKDDNAVWRNKTRKTFDDLMED